MPGNRRPDRAAREARQRLRDYTARQSVHAERLRRRRRDNVLAIVAGTVALTLAAVAQVLYFTAGPGVPAPTPSATPSPSASASVPPPPALNPGP